MSESARLRLRVIKALKGHTLGGMANSEIAKAVFETPVNVSRALSDLVAEGFAEKNATGRYVLSVSVLQIAQAHQTELERARARFDELHQRTTRTVY